MTNKELDEIPATEDWNMAGDYAPAKYSRPRRPFRSLRCLCGGRVFRVFDTAPYETSVRCETCGQWEVVHDG